MQHFDHILEEKIQHGTFQINTIIGSAGVFFIEGVEITILGIMLTLLQNEWDLNMQQTSWLGAIAYVGISIGLAFSAIFSDYIGRVNTVIIFSLITAITLFSSSFSQSYEEMFVYRLLFGVCLGAQWILPYILTAEQCVKSIRGRAQVLISSFYQLGKIYFIILCIIVLEDYENGNWRLLVRLNTIPALFTFFYTLSFVLESPRLFLSQKKYCKSFKQINTIIRQNNQNNAQLLSQQDRDILVFQTLNQRIYSKLEQFLLLFDKKNLKCTLLLTIITSLYLFQSNSMYILLPYVLNKENQGFGPLLIAYICEIIPNIISFFLIDETKTKGRLGVLMLGTMLQVVFSFGIFFLRNFWISITITILKLSYRPFFASITALISETYQTHQRTLASNFIHGIGNFLSSLGSFLLILFEIDTYLPFLVLGVLATIQLIFIIIYPVDKTQQGLESDFYQKE